MNDAEIKSRDINDNPIDTVYILNKYAIFSTNSNDALFGKGLIKEPIFCAGVIKDFERNVNNFKINEFVGYISFKQKLELNISSNLIFKLYESDKKLIALLPYASYAMKILRMVNPKIGHNIFIIGLNYFSILLLKLFKLTGAQVYIYKNKDDISIRNISKEKEYIFDDLEYLKKQIKERAINHLIIVLESKGDFKTIERSSISNILDLKKISIYDKGLEDLNYIRGVKYPYPYVRWDYKNNLEYFLSLCKKKEIQLEFFKFESIELSSLIDIYNKIEEINDNKLILFKISN